MIQEHPQVVLGRNGTMMKLQAYNPGRRARGLTLGEMMVVLVVFSLLAAIFFLSSSHALVKTRLSRALSEERVLASALQRYEAEYLDVPSQNQGLAYLVNAPNTYLSQIPLDPFTQPGKEPQHYYYLRSLSSVHRWLIVSAGPDGHADLKDATDALVRQKVQLSGTSWGNQPLLTPDEARLFITAHTYDPTNGTISSGDIIKNYDE